MGSKKSRKKLKSVLNKTIPLYLAVILIIQSSAAVGLFEYYLMKKNFNSEIAALSKKTKSPEELVQILKQQVLPQQGYILSVKWNDIGKQLLSSGAIDQKKYEDLFSSEPQAKDYMKYLNHSSKDHMVINEKNSRFMVNTLWALGLVNKNPILSEGEMKTYGNKDPMAYASTGGWNLGSKPTSELYSSQEIIKLTPQQQEIVRKIAQNIYRPCCSNPTSFPDCNHGMAVLGYIELAVKQGLSEKQIYKDVLALNSFWFPQQYVELSAYFDKQGAKWETIDAKKILAADYSSAQGMQKVRQQVQNIPGFNTSGGGCAV